MKINPNDAEVQNLLDSNAIQYTEEKKEFSGHKKGIKKVVLKTRRVISRKTKVAPVLEGQGELGMGLEVAENQIDLDIPTIAKESLGTAVTEEVCHSEESVAVQDLVYKENGEDSCVGENGEIASEVEVEEVGVAWGVANSQAQSAPSSVEVEPESSEEVSKPRVGRPRGRRAAEDASTDEEVVGRRFTGAFQDEITGLPITLHEEIKLMTFYMLPLDMAEPKERLYTPEQVQRITAEGKLCRILPGVPVLSPESSVRVGIIDGRIEDFPMKFARVRNFTDPRSRKKGYLLGPGSKEGTSVLEIYSQILENVAVTRVWRQIEGMGGPDLTERILANLEAQYQLNPKANLEVSKHRQSDGQAVYEFDSQNFDADGEPLEKVEENVVEGRILREGVVIW